MLDEYGFETYEENSFPLAYLITFRTFGTWLHGDEKGSVGRSDTNVYGRPDMPRNEGLQDTMRWRMNQNSVILSLPERKIVEGAIIEVCERRHYTLHAVNARTNHVHVVLSAQMKPERIADSFKAYSTLKLRANGSSSKKIWSRGRSRQYLWKPKDVEDAVNYVLFGQGDVPFR